jgi:aspartyl-tRNA(Asn)/glutamyl-tRNA(Gln) amidotransferase subunit B
VGAGGRVEQETLHFDPRTEAITSLRSKEEAHDYRYFPEPDLVPLVPTEAMMERARAALPELPAERAARYEGDWSLPADTARLFAFEPEWGNYFEAVTAAANAEPRIAANWVTELRSRAEGPGDVEPAALATLVDLADARTVTAANARVVLDRLVANGGGDPAAIVEAEGLGAIGGTDMLDPAVQAALDANPDIAERLRAGDMKPIGVIVGHVMRETRGRADGGEVTRIVREKLGL